MPRTTLTDGSPVTDDHREIDPRTGMQKGYVVLSAEERAKGFVRPVRRSYRHVGIRPAHPTRPLTPKEREVHGDGPESPVLYETYPESMSPLVGRYWTKAMLESGCGLTTTMSQPLAETYARDPGFHGGTFCAYCRQHFPVGREGQFVWEGTDERVGT